MPCIIFCVKNKIFSKLNIAILFCSTVFVILLNVSRLKLTGNIFPFPGNQFYNFGLGPILLKDVEILKLNHLSQLPDAFWFLISTIGLLNMTAIVDISCILINDIIKKKNTDDSKKIIFLCLFFTIIFLLYFTLMIAVCTFDRYLIFLIPIVVFILLISLNNFSVNLRKNIFIPMLIVFSTICFSIAATHDYLALNRTRWNAINYILKTEKVSRCEIDGGLEYNAWYCYKYSFNPVKNKSYWWVENDKYIISCGEIKDYAFYKVFTYKKIIPYGKAYLYVLKKENKKVIN
ncbi:MAG: hypothetical protein WC223_12690 [Bacteroidales bacterium]